ncbi:MAG: hypothetical protein ACODAA_00835 [Gemmatimonadota bacterium]
MTLYSILDRQARSWWYHRQLRDEGNEREARKRERRSIRSTLDSLRQALDNDGALTIGRYGATLHYSEGGRVQGLHRGTIEAARHLGIPIIDSRTVPDERLVDYAYQTPMYRPGATDPDGDPGPFDYVSLPTYVRIARSYGATIENWNEEARTT